ncbi:MAG: hypothetical protein ETSY1_40435 [Candidatus Entotheonella factor]|uniref:Hydantoinase/oxoprolinase N-terminal domain-containing protein n=1 Tax=Entotheonella factor TaxID=1429438 RepID=W4L719_ENTF1|nr:MAG: hypothetical protein ETSY1_40435 [Candidatus Entotheonella factor]
MRRIGIDVGGTNTDAVLIDDGRVVRAVKAPTSEDVTAGILQALTQLRTAPEGQGDVDAVMIGTTHFINAVVQRRQLTPVGALRIGEPISATLPPFCDWPPDVAAIAKGAIASTEGGFEYDGRPIMPLDEAAIRQTARQMRDQGLRSVAISAIFPPLIAVTSSARLRSWPRKYRMRRSRCHRIWAASVCSNGRMRRCSMRR